MRKIMNIKKTLSIPCVALAFLFILALNVSAASFDTIVAFGDSLSDNGNLYSEVESAVTDTLYWEGRFSNGPLWVEYLSGVTFSDVTTSGVTFLDCTLEDYAWGGAESSGTTPPGLIEQVEEYIVDVGGLAPAGTLITIWIGANDIRRAQFSIQVSSITGNIRDALDLLATSGVSDILILNLPDLGAVPALKDDPNKSSYATAISNSFNASLAKELSSFQDANPDIHVYGLDIFGFFQDIIADTIGDQSKYGFTNVTETSPDFDDHNGTTWDSEGHAFWDEIHPTTEAHIEVAKQAVFALDGSGKFPITYVPPVESGGGGGGCFIDSLFSYK
jgi:thermolabile hemolysin